MSQDQFRILKSELKIRAEKVKQYIQTQAQTINIDPPDLREALTTYLLYGGKMLRPGVLLLACGAVGGDESLALPAAAAIELFHTWTLVHDDIIDQDEKRRGQDALHIKYYKRALANDQFKLSEEHARHFGQSLSILAGDALHGMSISCLTELFFSRKVDPHVVLRIIKELDTTVLNTLVSGETLDVFYSKQDISLLTEEKITAMLWGKTGALLEFAGTAGALIGLNTADLEHKYVKALSTFTSKCGIAFQLFDDILGIVGDEKKLGKPVGSDIREGKKTTVIFHALSQANSAQRQKITNMLGRQDFSPDEFDEVISLIRDLGGIQTTRKKAHAYLTEALQALEIVPQSKYTDLLTSWAHYMINRES